MRSWLTGPSGDLVRIAASTVLFYALTLIAVRLAGRRTLATLSAFDALVTIALGSLLATVIVDPSIPLSYGAAALLTLLVLQVAVGALRRAVPATRRLLDFRPLTLFADGEPTDDRGALGPQITRDELLAALRQRGFTGLEDVSVVILEANGEVSVIPRSADRS
jgi:uncharacterized membrane protein YcaP (DUF421 family)